MGSDLFERLVDAVTDYAIFVIDPEGRIASWNSGAQRIKGYSEAEIVGTSFARFYTAEDRRGGKPARMLATASREGHVEDEGWRVRKDGTRFWARVVLSRIVTADGKLLGFAKVTQDLTERREAEERSRLLAQSQQSARMKDEFLASVSHELRTPIHAVVGWLQILRKEGLDRAARTRALDAVERNAQAQARLIEDLLDVSRMTLGKLRVTLTTVEVEPIVEAALDVVRPAASAKGVTVTAEHANSLPRVLGDRDRLVQIVWNVLTNAVKFTPSGGRVSVATRIRKREVEIAVTDTGRGIAKEFLPVVFDRFRQAEPSTTRSVGGLGMGLTIARHLVELHGGTVSAESEGLGKGATFRIRLPKK